MSTKLTPQTAKDMLDQDRDKNRSETERVLDRSSRHSDKPSGEQTSSSEDKLKRAAEQNDRRNRTDG